MNTTSPSLFGLSSSNSNKDFSNRKSWGKNQFNNAFPVALACYMHEKNINPVYLKLSNECKVLSDYIEVKDVFGLEPLDNNLFFSFETDFPPYRTMVVNNLPGIDLVTSNIENEPSSFLRGIEIKLTAFPDSASSSLPVEEQGSEIVIRPDSIVYLAFSLAQIFKDDIDELKKLMDPFFERNSDVEWEDFTQIKPLANELETLLDNILVAKIDEQTPLLMQPIWKTQGESLLLEDNCFDMYIWSNYAFTRLFVNHYSSNGTRVDRKLRTLVWLILMIYEFSKDMKINHEYIIDTYSYFTKNDKAFAIGGKLTNRYMKHDILKTPRIKKEQLNNIILGGGHMYLSPERRLDAAILSTPGLFD